jgi:hypothetical protein
MNNRTLLVSRFALALLLTVGGNCMAVAQTGNTVLGANAFSSNTIGVNDSVFGYYAMQANTSGSNNTASGFKVLYSNTTGLANTAIGSTALFSNTTGYDNTASGFAALYSNTTAGGNTANGNEALFSNTTGYDNTASGDQALYSNTTGTSNSALGLGALHSNTTGNGNTACGVSALYNATGDSNTASGVSALLNATTGYRNVAFGYRAGFAVTTGSDNIIVGGQNQGKAGDNGVIRVGTSAYQKKAFIAGIRGVKTGATGAVAVLIDANGQLGTINSSRRFKEDIQPMGSVSERLYGLRPVTFRYKQPYDDGSKPVQFGLIAEEVAEAFPELVVYGQDGKPETVSYHLLATLLLNEVQKDHRVMVAQTERIASLEKQTARIAALEQQVAMLGMVVGPMAKDRMLAFAR